MRAHVRLALGITAALAIACGPGSDTAGSATGATCAPAPDPGAGIAPPGSALHVLPPLGADSGDTARLDRTLEPYLTVAVCEIAQASCPDVRTFTGGGPRAGGLESIVLQDGQYHVNWKVGREEAGRALRIRFVVVGLQIGTLDVAPEVGRTIPIKFRIDRHPAIRGRVLRAQGSDATQVAVALRDEFGTSTLQTAWILAQAGFGPVDTGAALQGVFALGDLDAAQILKWVGYGSAGVYQALKQVYGLDVAAAKGILEAICFGEAEIVDALVPELAVRFAPQLRFDSGGQVCSAADTYPMSAQAYFEARTGGNTGLLSNADAGSVTGNAIPIYFKYFLCGRQIRLVYWMFYGYQYPCDCVSGSHDADWEHLVVVLSEDATRAAAVSFFQHSGNYTRYLGRGGFTLMDGTHPLVYVGRTSHGSYHLSQSAFQDCCYWEDKRNGHGPWMDAWKGPVVRMQPVAAGGEPWMDADADETFTWGGIGQHPMNSGSGDCGLQTCEGLPIWGCTTSGCFRSQCEVGDRDDGITCWHCPRGYVDWGTFCVKDCSTYPFCSSTSIHTYGMKYTVSQDDSGLLYSKP